MKLIDPWRAVILLPLLAVAAAGIWWFALRGGASDVPPATFIETPPGAVTNVGVGRGDLARDFVATSPDGERVRLSDLRGTPVVINFWASWCTSCLAEMPELRRAQDEAGAGNLHVVAINVGEDNATARRFLRELDVVGRSRAGMDPTQVLADNYGIPGLPSSVFVDADGVVRGVYIGQLQTEDLEMMLAAARAGVDAAEPDPQLRLVTTVARDDELRVERTGEGRAVLRSRSLRCDDSYCAEATLDALAGRPGVQHVERVPGADPPTVVVRFDAGASDIESIAEWLALELDAADQLYGRPIEVVFE